VGALCDVARDFVEMELHGLGVGWGQGERRADAAGWANRSEQIGVFVALICGLARPGSALGPLPDLAILLANVGLVLKPDFDRRCLWHAVEMGAQRAREVYGMARPSFRRRRLAGASGGGFGHGFGNSLRSRC